MIISTPRDTPVFEQLIGDGRTIGCNLSYAVQERPEGLAQAFIIAKSFIGNEKVALILGDNIFYASGLSDKLQECANPDGAVIFAYHVSDPERYGVVEFDKDNKVISIEEKPSKPKSNFAVPGLYFYDNEVVDVAASICPSARGELEITEVNKYYLQKSKLYVRRLDRGTAWLDTGTFRSLIEAGNFVQAIEERQSLKIGCIEEIAYKMGYITKEELEIQSSKYQKSGYGQYLSNLLEWK